MEKTTEEQVLKSRSARSCISAGYRLYIGNFKRIFRATWLTALLAAVMSGVASSVLSGQVTLTPTMLVVAVATLMLGLVANVVLGAQLFGLLAKHREEVIIPVTSRWFSVDKRMLVRTLVWTVFAFIISLLGGILIGTVVGLGIAHQSLVMLGSCVLLALVLALLEFPLIHPAIHYLTTQEKGFFKITRRGYGEGMRHYGLLFVVMLVVTLLTMVVLMLTTLPAIILATANMRAQAGVAMGDPLGMPSYMSTMTIAVMSIAAFIQSYLMLSIFFPAYYASGSIETQEQERNEKKNSLY